MTNHKSYTIILRQISIILLFLALLNNLYYFYQVLRWIICGTALYTGWTFHQTDNIKWSYPFFIIGILFNPIAPFFLDKGIWSTIDIVVAVFFIFSLSKKTNEI